MSNLHPGCRYTHSVPRVLATTSTCTHRTASHTHNRPATHLSQTHTILDDHEGESMDTNTVSITGNLVDDPTIRFTPDNTPVVEFRLAHNRRKRGPNGEWEDGRRVYITVRAWRRLAETIASSLNKGDAVRVDGTLTHDEWVDDAGKRRETISIDARDVRAPLVAAASDAH